MDDVTSEVAEFLATVNAQPTPTTRDDAAKALAEFAETVAFTRWVCRGLPGQPGEVYYRDAVSRWWDRARDLVDRCRPHLAVPPPEPTGVADDRQMDNAIDTLIEWSRSASLAGPAVAMTARAGDSDTPPMPPSAFSTVDDLARALGLAAEWKSALDQWLRRRAQSNPDCRIDVETPRRGEPHYLYRVADVWQALIDRLPRWR